MCESGSVSCDILLRNNCTVHNMALVGNKHHKYSLTCLVIILLALPVFVFPISSQEIAEIRRHTDKLNAGGQYQDMLAYLEDTETKYG